mgnify:CR=1 FL=1
MSRRMGVYMGLIIFVVGNVVSRFDGFELIGTILLFGGLVWLVVATIGAIIERTRNKKSDG